MSPESPSTSRSDLIQRGLDGKNRAIAAYDEMLWKIRTGYVAVLYGVFTLVVSLGDTTQWPLSVEKAGLVAITLITGFTLCAAVLDFSFLRSKFRVIQSKEELVKLALWLASDEELEAWEGTPLLTLLYNSGERRAQVRWKERTSIWPIALLYLGTWGPICLAVIIMVS